LVASVAGALTLSNDAAITQGTDPANSLVAIAEEQSSAGRVWCIKDGPRDYIGRRDGDMIVLADEGSDAGRRLIRGQWVGRRWEGRSFSGSR
jgi:hypothetical protein